jgi:hypothetical protein
MVNRIDYAAMAVVTRMLVVVLFAVAVVVTRVVAVEFVVMRLVV